MSFHLRPKKYYFHLSPGGWECNGNILLWIMFKGKLHPKTRFRMVCVLSQIHQRFLWKQMWRVTAKNTLTGGYPAKMIMLEFLQHVTYEIGSAVLQLIYEVTKILKNVRRVWHCEIFGQVRDLWYFGAINSIKLEIKFVLLHMWHLSISE